jgi:methyltransferase
MSEDRAGSMAKAARMKEIIRAYIQACNDADAKAIAACFRSDAVHYFPAGDPRRTKWLGATTIGSNFAKIVEEQGVCWTVDQLVVDVDRGAAVLEWTRFNRERDRLIRGVDWFVFDPKTLFILEVRPYSAAPIDWNLPRQELGGFDYAGRGYPT